MGLKGEGEEFGVQSVKKVALQEQAVGVAGSRCIDQGRAVLSALSAGALAPGQGSQLIAAIGALARVAEIDELTARIIKLEESKNAES